MTAEFTHTPVLLATTLEALRPRPDGRFLDATLGAGGHAEAILEATSPTGTLLGIDADPLALAAAGRRLAPFGDRITLAESYFDHLDRVARDTNFTHLDGVLFDLGVSSPQLDVPERGFSFQGDAPLDMRFGPGAERTAADLVNALSAADLQRIFQEYGEERNARRVAQRIVAERARAPIRTTIQLADLVRAAKPPARDGIHPATRVFQALRIAVNDELGRLQRALPQALAVLRHGGRLAVISFHSLEDRIVKQFMRREASDCICPPELPVCVCGHKASLRIVTARPLTPAATEVAANPRARSARLRVAEKVTSDFSSGSSE